MIRHAEDSKAEGHPGYIRVITPRYVSYTPLDSFDTNYTDLGNSSHPVAEPVDLLNATSGQQQDHHHTNMFHFVFPFGISFPDIIELNFTLTVDPLGVREVGSGREPSAVLLVPVCGRNVIDGYPSDTPDDIFGLQDACGDPLAIPISTMAPGCFIIPQIIIVCSFHDIKNHRM